MLANGLIVLIMSCERYIIICRPEKKASLELWKHRIYQTVSLFLLIIPVAMVVEALVTTRIMDGTSIVYTNTCLLKFATTPSESPNEKIFFC